VYTFAVWDDCYKLAANANTGYYMNALAANGWAVQPPFCFGFSSTLPTVTSTVG